MIAKLDLGVEVRNRVATLWGSVSSKGLYEQAEVRAADLAQLEKISSQFETREKFLTELALDPPAATSDLAGAPYLDEDWLVLSTVHSAKGQEWDAVYLLNVADGNFPSEFATGRAELIEEERRLLYVAMTRAKSELHLMAPVKYYVTQQSRQGDKHIYGARSRFVTADVMACMAQISWPEAAEFVNQSTKMRGARVDIAGKMRTMW